MDNRYEYYLLCITLYLYHLYNYEPLTRASHGPSTFPSYVERKSRSRGMLLECWWIDESGSDAHHLSQQNPVLHVDWGPSARAESGVGTTPTWRSKCTKNKARTTLMSAIYFSCIYPYPHYFSKKTPFESFARILNSAQLLRLGAQSIFSAQYNQRTTLPGRAIQKAAQLLKARNMNSCIKNIQ